jgi:uncharacterized spore protein YtfJ
MEAEIERLLDLVAELREKADVKAVFGEPMTIEGRTVVPVAKVAYGFGLGMGHMAMVEPEAGTEMDQPPGQEAVEKDDGTGGRGGGAVMAQPFAVIEVTPEGTKVEPIVNEQKLALAGSLLVGWGIFWLGRALIKIFQRE